ncbi:hypothetical protein [Paucisalibacillus sp. EB02]|uniref:hypothetical protein n=1 Tax=Paucisalibacillus sp. EB02 TaxID=1347087 RepID=UPI0004BC294C|nr:hypothetical protein [Paucisalibacillus sp. EB02]
MDIFTELDEKLFNDSLIDLNIRKKLKFDSKNEFYQSVKSKKKCMFPNCESKSIKRSHTIPKSGSLKLISDDSHLLYPHLDEDSDELRMVMDRIGIGDASTFPGFCKKHEMIFSEFEQKKEIDSIEQAKLQAYRSICREIVIDKLHLDKVRIAIYKYKNERNKQYRLVLENKISKKIEKVKVEYDDYRIKFAKIAQSKLTEKLEFSSKIHKKFLEIIKNEQTQENVVMNVVNIDMKFPVALSGVGYANITDNKKNNREIKMILNVIPFKSSTVLIFAGDIIDKDILENHYDYVVQHPLFILNFIESFMMHGTDHWFIQPKIWNEMDGIKQKYILDYFFVTENSFLEDVNFSIFDDIRKEFLESFPIPEKIKEIEIEKLNFNFNNTQKPLTTSIIEKYNNFHLKNDI